MRCWLGIYIYLLILFILLALSIFSYFEDNNHSHHTIKQQIVHKFHIEAVQRKYPVKVGKEESILLSFFPFLLLLLSKCQYSLPHTIKYEQCLNTVLAMELQKFNRFSWCQVFLKYIEKKKNFYTKEKSRLLIKLRSSFGDIGKAVKGLI